MPISAPRPYSKPSANRVEAFTITGAGDMWARVVARSNADLQRVIDLVVADASITRSSTVIALDTQIRYRVLPLLRDAAVPRGRADE